MASSGVFLVLQDIIDANLYSYEEYFFYLQVIFQTQFSQISCCLRSSIYARVLQSK